MTILTRGGWYRRKHGTLACVTPAHWHRARSTRHPPSPALSWPARGGMNGTPSSSSIARCRSGAEREAGRQRTVTEHDAMAGNHAGFGIGVQREADEPRIAWAAGQRRDLTVGLRPLLRGIRPDDVIHRTVERCRTVGRRCAAG